jgi:hypothetical protein
VDISGEPHGGGHGGFHLLWSLLGFGQKEGVAVCSGMYGALFETGILILRLN